MIYELGCVVVVIGQGDLACVILVVHLWGFTDSIIFQSDSFQFEVPEW